MPAWLGLRAALDVILLVMTVLGGRVIPMFTRNGVPGARVRSSALVERIVPVSAVALLFCDVVSSPPVLLAIVLGYRRRGSVRARIALAAVANPARAARMDTARRLLLDSVASGAARP